MEDMDLDRSFWVGRRVLVTGHTGFKGSWLCLWLHALGADVTGYALAPAEGPSLFADLRLADRIRSVIGDVRDETALAGCMRASNPEVVLHLAAQSLVRPAYADPVGTYATNVMGTVNLLEAVRRQGAAVRAVVNVTSDKCYENLEWSWGYREIDRLGGHDPYSNSKAVSELVTSAYRSSFFYDGSSTVAAIGSARAGNVIGGGDWATDRLIPDMIRSFENGRRVSIRNPDAVRPWQHVLEPLRGYLLLAERLTSDGRAYAEAWNFGPSETDAQPVRWIADTLCGLWGADVSWAIEGGPRVHEAQTLRLDCSKARARLAWAPRWNLDEALRRVASWYAARDARKDMIEFSLGQIADYEGAATT